MKFFMLSLCLFAILLGSSDSEAGPSATSDREESPTQTGLLYLKTLNGTRLPNRRHKYTIQRMFQTITSPPFILGIFHTTAKIFIKVSELLEGEIRGPQKKEDTCKIRFLVIDCKYYSKTNVLTKESNNNIPEPDFRSMEIYTPRLGDYPHAVIMQRPISGDLFKYCTGALISLSHVLTAGPCLLNVTPSDVAVVAGSLTFMELFLEIFPPIAVSPLFQKRSGSKIIVSQEDGILIILIVNIDFVNSPHVSPISLLPSGMATTSNYFVDRKATIVGWKNSGVDYDELNFHFATVDSLENCKAIGLNVTDNKNICTFQNWPTCSDNAAEGTNLVIVENCINTLVGLLETPDLSCSIRHFGSFLMLDQSRLRWIHEQGGP